jgi:hypothetical protein
VGVVNCCKVHPSNISHTGLASPPTPITLASLHTCCCRTVSCHFVATPCAGPHHARIFSSISKSGQRLPVSLLHCQTSSSRPCEDTLGRSRASATICASCFPVALGSIGGGIGCWGCVYIQPAKLRAFSTIRFGRHTLPTTRPRSVSLFVSPPPRHSN